MARHGGVVSEFHKPLFLFIYLVGSQWIRGRPQYAFSAPHHHHDLRKKNYHIIMLLHSDYMPFSEWLALHLEGDTPQSNPDAFNLDWWLTTEHPAFDALLSQLSRELSEALGTQRQYAGRLPNLRALLASLLEAYDREPGKPTKYSRRPAAWLDRDEDRPDWASCRIILSFVDGLARLGYVGSVVGTYDGHTWRGRLSLVWPLPPLVTLCERLGLPFGSFHQERDRLPVIMKTDRSRRGGAVKLRHSACQAVAVEIASVAATVARFNAYMSGHQITMDRLPEGVEKGRHVNLSRTDCYRIFNNIDPDAPRLDQGGRYYGGAFQSVESRLRPYLMINGERTVELDYGSFHVRMLYHRDGLNSPAEPYDVPSLSRGTAKIITNRLINATNRQIAAACRESRERVLARWEIELPQGVELRDAINAVRTIHAPIARHFGMAEGLRLQNLDSEICNRILCSAVAADIPILPIHDSFVVRDRDAEWLKNRMTTEYKIGVGPFEPTIKTKRRQDRERLKASWITDESSRQHSNQNVIDEEYYSGRGRNDYIWAEILENRATAASSIPTRHHIYH